MRSGRLSQQGPRLGSDRSQAVDRQGPSVPQKEPAHASKGSQSGGVGEGEALGIDLDPPTTGEDERRERVDDGEGQREQGSPLDDLRPVVTIERLRRMSARSPSPAG